MSISVGDASHIEAPDGAFDAVFDFGIIHHIPDWRAATAEVHRVLLAGRPFYFEEVTRHALDRWSYRTFLDHPADDRFTAQEFIAQLERDGLRVGDRWCTWCFGDFILGVATKDGP
ncbi:MAG: methyltransferase domain-containing protein [Acidimicrobiia bacterium]